MQVRAVEIPDEQIKEIEDMYGAKLVKDEEVSIILHLDEALARYRIQHKKDPDFVALSFEPGVLYKHMPLTINFMGFQGKSEHKPAWFRFKKTYRGVSVR